MGRSLMFLKFILLVGQLGSRVYGLGINWGTRASHQLPPKTTVQLLKDNDILKAKLFEADETIFNALAGSDIEVMIAISNGELEAMGDFDNAKEWIKANVTKYTHKGGVNIKYVAVGNEPFLKAYNGSHLNTTFPALKNIQNALNDAGVGDTIKATVPLNADVYESPDKNPDPSAGKFRPDILGTMTKMCDFLAKNKAPFTVNIYPFLSLYGNDHFPIDYAFFEGATPVVDSVTGIKYTNVFDANYDTCVSALKAAGHDDMPVIVGEVGWPTDGDKNANIANAYRYYKGLLPKLAGEKGTPLRPGYIEVYMFGLFDEDQKSIDPGNFERHWGIFTYDGQPKFPMDFSGKGENKTLVVAKDVKYLPKKWCMVNPEANDTSKLAEKMGYAYNNSDCSTLGFGSSCNNLDGNGNASYAFNMYYQLNNQKDAACDFQGLGKITTENISQGECNFIIQLKPFEPPLAPPPNPDKSSSSGSSPNSPSSKTASSASASASASSDSASASTSSSPSLVALALALVLTFMLV